MVHVCMMYDPKINSSEKCSQITLGMETVSNGIQMFYTVKNDLKKIRIFFFSVYRYSRLFCLYRYHRKTIQNTPFQQHTIFSNTEMLWGGFLFLFLYNIFYNTFFFQLKSSLFGDLNILSLITASTEMWYPKIWNCCWDWWLLNGHLLYGSSWKPWMHLSKLCKGRGKYQQCTLRIYPLILSKLSLSPPPCLVHYYGKYFF